MSELSFQFWVFFMSPAHWASIFFLPLIMLFPPNNPWHISWVGGCLMYPELWPHLGLSQLRGPRLLSSRLRLWQERIDQSEAGLGTADQSEASTGRRLGSGKSLTSAGWLPSPCQWRPVGHGQQTRPPRKIYKAKKNMNTEDTLVNTAIKI